MTTKGLAKPYIKFIGNSAVGVTGSMHLVRYQKYVILLDCGMIQEGDIVTAYKKNMEQLKKVKVREVDYIIISHNQIDHIGLLPALYARGCQAHIFVVKGSLPFLKLQWEDSMKIFTADCQKIQKKHSNIKAIPYYTQEDINNALSRCIEVPYDTPRPLFNSNNYFTFINAGHIIHSTQIYLHLQTGIKISRIGYTGDIGGNDNPFDASYLWAEYRKDMPYVDILIGENTYNSQTRPNKAYDKKLDNSKIINAIRDSKKVLIPCFSLMRTQVMLSYLYHLWLEGFLNKNIKVYLDSPLAQKFCDIWPDTYMWETIKNWPNLHYVKSWEESEALQNSNESCVILSASGFLSGGRVLSHLKTILPDPNNHILFCGYSGENNLASQIKHGDSDITIDRESIPNKANISELYSFSSHASYEQLLDYYSNLNYKKIYLVHGDYRNTPEFAKVLQDRLSGLCKTSRVIVTNKDTKCYL